LPCAAQIGKTGARNFIVGAGIVLMLLARPVKNLMGGVK
jgi:hypothetical protein